MKIFFNTVLTACIFFNFALSQENILGRTVKLNDFVDDIFENIRKFGGISGLEPLSLPDIYKEKEDDFYFVKFTEKYNLTNGKVKNLSTIQRNGDIVAKYYSKILILLGSIEFLNLQVDFDIDAKIWKMDINGSITGILSNYRMDIATSYDVNKFQATLEKFVIPQIGNIIFSMNTTNPLYGDIFEKVINTITILFQDIIIYEISQKVAQNIQKSMDTISSPDE